MYTALVLTEKSRQTLLKSFQGLIPPTWEVIAHHMTINMGNAASGPLAQSEFEVGQTAKLVVTHYAYDALVMAAGVECEVPSANTRKHITLAVNRREGGKPFYSNKLTDWSYVSPIELEGVIEEVT
ncbi:MAG: hypothetical protein DWQ19_09745 [Crenarchaeota archaeon]|nr:MAG: hypothetical protein DWQ19_09745 [Thermoproteota archaeon]